MSFHSPSLVAVKIPMEPAPPWFYQMGSWVSIPDQDRSLLAVLHSVSTFSAHSPDTGHTDPHTTVMYHQISDVPHNHHVFWHFQLRIQKETKQPIPEVLGTLDLIRK